MFAPGASDRYRSLNHFPWLAAPSRCEPLMVQCEQLMVLCGLLMVRCEQLVVLCGLLMVQCGLLLTGADVDD